ncbi:ABC transporter permease [Paracoccus aminophilus]|uniref:ABC-type nitrate/sulfonate/bicarbonate transport system, permease component n=1 Tax=Paracoccus aminophilus JCM 7686 TaxID=1367847 RepID=S5Z150_PARAH|nr:ABC transporter permease [Paracoccus aminophilus]AGT11156.1 ABC-type nitrate/sulfonate/bicarbonate transport system, permease component [Paracoccus aminophilus JCM 7686]
MTLQTTNPLDLSTLRTLPRPSSRRMAAVVRATLARYGIILAALLLWEVTARLGWINTAVFPAPSTIVAAMGVAIDKGIVQRDLAISLQRSGLAFGAAVLVSIPLGLVMGTLHRLERVLDPVLQLFRQLSALALYPVFILLLGLGETSKVFVIFWGTAFPLLLATIGGVKEVDHKLVEMARSYGANRVQIFRRVILPAALPQIFVGLRLSATTALLMLIASEMIGANSGVGFQVMNAQYNFQIGLMFGYIGLLALLGLAANGLIVALQRHLCRWNTKANY